MFNLTAQQFRQAADLQERIESLQGQLNRLLGTPGTAKAVAAPAAPAAGGKRQISAAGIERIRAAQRARWAKVKRAKAPAAAKRGKRRLSPAARAKLAALAKARWAKAKQAGKKSL